MNTLGICFGASTLQWVRLTCTEETFTVTQALRIPHEGNPGKILRDLLHTVSGDIDRVAVTGRAFRKAISLTSISEPEAVESALSRVYKNSRVVRIL